MCCFVIVQLRDASCDSRDGVSASKNEQTVSHGARYPTWHLPDMAESDVNLEEATIKYY